jgi:deoxynucleoside triphosphate triphosphohydrolase SAMHD1
VLAEYETAIENFAADRLSAYTDWVRSTFVAKRAGPKEINDPVWGTLALTAVEVLVLDSPLLQRLRRVGQLGVAQWVYPGARHSRLEHSIGALALMARLISALGVNSGVPVPAQYTQPLRLAALCHDVGHGVMSHVSENALSYCEATEDLKREFSASYGREAALGEINSFLLVGSTAFQALLTAATGAARVGQDVDDLAAFMQRCIIAQVVDPKYPVLHQLVSGPFDADKLDYMTRDAYMSGVPVVTDINRLIQKVRSVSVPVPKAPRVIQELTNDQNDTVVVFGIDRSGNRTVDELTLGRTLLFDKLYRHHKTRACEAMVAAVLLRMAACLCGRVSLKKHSSSRFARTTRSSSPARSRADSRALNLTRSLTRSFST